MITLALTNTCCMIKKYTLLFVTFSLLLTASAQEVISTQGDSYSNSDTNIDFTIGEVVINTVSTVSNDLTQGFHQTNWKFVSLEDLAPTFEVSVFPNPSSSVLNIKAVAFEQVSFVLYDVNGKLVAENMLTSELTSIEVSHLSTGNYTLVLKNDSHLLKTVKLIKSL